MLDEKMDVSDIFSEAQTVETKADILAMSCAMYRLKDNNMFYSLTHAVDNIEHHVTSADVDMAKQIRDYYASKWLLKMVTQKVPLTKFRTDLMRFITRNSDNYVYPKSYLGLIYKLPYFYNYDIELDELYSKCNTNISNSDIDFYSTLPSGSRALSHSRLRTTPEIIYDTPMSLSFLKVLDPSKKNKDVFEFIFVNNNGYMFILEIEKNNSFLKFFQKYIREHRMITFEGQFRLKNRDGNEFYRSTVWEFCG